MYESVNSIAAVDSFARRTGLLAWMRRRCRDGITMLMYHKVLPEPLASKYALRNLVVDTPLFDSQMAWLSAHFDVLTVSEAVDFLEHGKVLRSANARPIACVTFDDGYRDNFTYASPILKAHGFRATFYVTTGFVEGAVLWFDQAALAWQQDAGRAMRSAREFAPEFQGVLTNGAGFGAWLSVLKKLPAEARGRILNAVATPADDQDEIFAPMTPGQIRELADAGHEIGSHSVTHPILTNVDDASLKRELEDSRSSLRAWSGQAVDGFCYPNGDHDARVIKAVRSAGYRYGSTVLRGMVRAGSDLMALPRRAILSSGRQEAIEAGYQAEVVGYHDWLRRIKKRFS